MAIQDLNPQKIQTLAQKGNVPNFKPVSCIRDRLTAESKGACECLSLKKSQTMPEKDPSVDEDKHHLVNYPI